MPKRKADSIVELDDDSVSINSDSSSSLELLEDTKKKSVPVDVASSQESTSALVDEPSSTEAEQDSFDVVIPPMIANGNAGGECTIMVEVDPEDAAILDYEGISGAIGRFEANEQGSKYNIFMTLGVLTSLFA